MSAREWIPREDQELAMGFARSRDAAALWIPMGMGKTASAATVAAEALDRFDVERWLVVAPKLVAAKAWPDELAKWRHLAWLTHKGITAADLCLADYPKDQKTRFGRWKLTNTREARKAILADLPHITRVSFDMLPYLVKLIGAERWPWDGVIFDEASGLKDQSSLRFRAMSHVRPKITKLIELAGTPAPNGLLQVYPQVALMDGGERLGRTLTAYREEYFRPDQRGRDGTVYSWELREGAREAIHARLGDLCMSLKAEDWLKLPPLIYNTVKVALPEAARRQYDALERDLIIRVDEGEVAAGSAGVLWGKLMQMANGAIYDADKQAHTIHTAKLDALEEIIDSHEGGVLVAYWFQHDLAAIKKRIPIAQDMGDLEVQRKWDKGLVKVGLLHPRSGGHGLNLQDGGSTAVWYSLPPADLELYQQWNKRLHRPGQAADRVVIQHIIAEDTIDEDILASLGDKGAEQDGLLAAVRARVERRTTG